MPGVRAVEVATDQTARDGVASSYTVTPKENAGDAPPYIVTGWLNDVLEMTNQALKDLGPSPALHWQSAVFLKEVQEVRAIVAEHDYGSEVLQAADRL